MNTHEIFIYFILQKNDFLLFQIQVEWRKHFRIEKFGLCGIAVQQQVAVFFPLGHFQMFMEILSIFCFNHRIKTLKGALR